MSGLNLPPHSPPRLMLTVQYDKTFVRPSYFPYFNPYLASWDQPPNAASMKRHRAGHSRQRNAARCVRRGPVETVELEF
jgi:hypothetical protein